MKKPLCKVCKEEHGLSEPHIFKEDRGVIPTKPTLIGSVTPKECSVTKKKGNVTALNSNVTPIKSNVTGSVRKQQRWENKNKEKMRLWRREYMKKYRLK